MEKKDKNILSEIYRTDLPENITVSPFSTDELVFCPKCRRTNAPTKINCIYCGELLGNAENKLISPTLEFHRKPEFWGNGFNLIYLPEDRKIDRRKIPLIAGLINMSGEVLENIFELSQSLPLIRTDSENDLEMIRQNIREYGVESIILSDRKLDLKNPPRRLRGIDFRADKISLILFNSLETIDIFREDLALIVSGKIFSRKLEATEKREKSQNNKLIESAESYFDDFLIDIYNRTDLIGYRISTTGFDFSCLGNEKGLRAVENITKLLNKLKVFGSNARAFEDFSRLAQILENIWEIEQKRETTGFKHSGIGKFNLEKKVITTNLEQFTKYSRLQRHLI